MTSQVVTLTFKESASLEQAEDSAVLASLAASGLYGQPRVRIESGYDVRRTSRELVIQAGSEVGRAIALIAAAFCEREFGAAGFTVSTSTASGAERAAA